MGKEAASRHWHFVEAVARDFGPHGYCARKSWIVHIVKALANRNLKGPFHPNAFGQEAYGRLIFAAVKPYLGS